MRKLKVGDKMIRNHKKLASDYNTDPRRIKLIAVASVQKGDNINGFKIQDIFTGKVEDASIEYIEYYYDLDLRKEKIIKLNEKEGS